MNSNCIDATWSLCLLCEEVGPVIKPYPCQHQLCEACLQKCQAHEMYRCPYCRVQQTSAVPSSEYKLLKLLLGVKHPETLERFKQALLAVTRCEEGAVPRLNEAISAAVVHMEDFRSQHLEAPVCLQLIDAILKGVLTIEQVRIILTTQGTAAVLLRLLQHHNAGAPPTSTEARVVEVSPTQGASPTAASPSRGAAAAAPEDKVVTRWVAVAMAVAVAASAIVVAAAAWA